MKRDPKMYTPPSEIKGELIRLGKYNDGILQTERIHNLQTNIHMAMTTPLLYDSELGLYGYELAFNQITELFQEAISKLSQDEIDKFNLTRKDIILCIKDRPVFCLIFDWRTRRNVVTFNDLNWNELREKLFNLQMYVRQLLSRHKMSAPEGDRPEEAAYK